MMPVLGFFAYNMMVQFLKRIKPATFDPAALPADKPNLWKTCSGSRWCGAASRRGVAGAASYAVLWIDSGLCMEENL
jgi:hypothetical protein